MTASLGLGIKTSPNKRMECDWGTCWSSFPSASSVAFGLIFLLYIDTLASVAVW
jgi:hypothetical protein